MTVFISLPQNRKPTPSSAQRPPSADRRIARGNLALVPHLELEVAT
jgi:hypothetical protein